MVQRHTRTQPRRAPRAVAPLCHALPSCRSFLLAFTLLLSLSHAQAPAAAQAPVQPTTPAAPAGADLTAPALPDGRALQFAQAGGRFGAAVALHGDLAVVGAPEEGSGNEGAAYVYRLTEDGWQLEQKLSAPEPSSGAFFGGAVATDAGRVVVGAWGQERVYLFRHVEGGWEPEAQLSSSAAGTGTRFGAAVLLEAGVLVVAAPAHGRHPERGGAVHLYRLEDDGWRPWSLLAPDDLPSGARFGASLALGDGLLAVGADGQVGAVYLFRLDAGTQQVARLTPPEADDVAAFGSSLALGQDLLAVGTPGGDYGGARSGPVYVYGRTGSEWKLTARLSARQAPSERFGTALALAGSTLVAALQTDNDLPSGRVRVVTFAVDGDGWSTVPAALLDLESEGVRYAALAADGARLLVGAPSERPAPGAEGDGGAVWLFQVAANAPP